jgi:hypothetical protein
MLKLNLLSILLIRALVIPQARQPRLVRLSTRKTPSWSRCDAKTSGIRDLLSIRILTKGAQECFLFEGVGDRHAVVV